MLHWYGARLNSANNGQRDMTLINVCTTCKESTKEKHKRTVTVNFLFIPFRQQQPNGTSHNPVRKSMSGMLIRSIENHNPRIHRHKFSCFLRGRYYNFLFIIRLFTVTFNRPDYIVQNGTIINQQWIGRDVKGSVRNLIWGAIRRFPSVEADYNNSTISLRVVEGDKKGTRCLGV
jgi:hypothetical protein